MTLIFTEGPGGACPCQASGTFDDCPFYFRARHGSWALCVVLKGYDPIWPEEQEDDDGNAVVLLEMGGDDPSDGWMAPDVAEGLIREAYEQFVKDRA